MILDAARVAPEKAVFRPALPMLLQPGLNGTDMTKLTYGEQLRHPNWQRKRLEMLEAADWQCENCGEKEITLHVHHKRYIKGRMAWEYEAAELAVLCDPCHEDEHHLTDELKAFLALVGVRQALAVLYGYFTLTAVESEGVGYSGRDRDPHAWAHGFVAFLCTELSPEKLLQVAEFAASLNQPGSEPLMHWLHGHYEIDFKALG
jgi:hypothetical protein